MKIKKFSYITMHILDKISLVGNSVRWAEKITSMNCTVDQELAERGHCRADASFMFTR